MQSQLVFQEKSEIERLHTQNKLLLQYEKPVFDCLFAGRQGLSVLDIGCNDGSKTLQRFSSAAFSQVIGLEYNGLLAQKARENRCDNRFSFYSLDVEGADFPCRLKEMMLKEGIGGFDVVCLSFVLMHLKNPKKLLLTLKPFLKADATVFIVEADDGASTLSRDEGGRLAAFLDILGKDRYAGNRQVGRGLVQILRACGYGGIRLWHDSISAEPGETAKKQDIFTTFFSYLPQDVALLLESEPENAVYRSWSRWLERNYEELKNQILAEQSEISMGMKILTCGKGTNNA